LSYKMVVPMVRESNVAAIAASATHMDEELADV
jgi:hypothetical protein